MVAVNLQNEPISIVLADGDSVTVPDGEVWSVLITGRSTALSADGERTRAVRINGKRVASTKAFMTGDSERGRASTVDTTFPIRTVVIGGDVITADNTATHVSGFVVRKP